MLPENHKIAIYTKFNELAERFGLKPYDINAAVSFDAKSEKATLEIEDGFPPDVGRKVEPMLDALGGKGGMVEGILTGSSKDIIDALDQALAKAPRLRLK